MRPTFHEAQLEDPQHHRKRFYLDLTVHYYHSPLIPHSCFSLDETKYVILLSSSCNDFVIQTLLEKNCIFHKHFAQFQMQKGMLYLFGSINYLYFCRWLSKRNWKRMQQIIYLLHLKHMYKCHIYLNQCLCYILCKVNK